MSLKKIDRNMFISNGETGRLSTTAPTEFKLEASMSKKKSGTPHTFQRLNLSKLSTAVEKGNVTGRKQIRIVSKFKKVEKRGASGRDNDTEGSFDTLNQVLEQK